MRKQAQPEVENFSDSDMPVAVNQSASGGQCFVADTVQRNDGVARKRRSSPATASRSCVVEQSTSSSMMQATAASSRLCASTAQSGIDRCAVDTQRSSNAQTNSPPVIQRKSLSTPYGYTAIKDINLGTTVNVYGVVKFVRPASRGRGAGKCFVCFPC